jgi:hypothetical protein
MGERANFEIQETQNSCFAAQFEFDIREGKLGGQQGNAVPGREVKTATANSAVMLDEKDAV